MAGARRRARRPSASRSRRRRAAGPTRELLAAARAGAAQLAARGAGRGERVAIALRAGLDFAQALHACLLLGAVAVPGRPAPAGASASASRAGAACSCDSPCGRRRRAARAPAARAAHDLDAIALIVHTSGTTSAPRPVELTYGNILWSALGSGVALGVDPRERWLCALPLSHVGGLSILLRSAIYATTAVVHERFETEPRAARRCASASVTLVSLVATTLARLLDAGLQHPPALRCALTGGGPVPAALRRAGARRGRAGEPHLRPHRGLLAGRRRPRPRRSASPATPPGRRCSARACAVAATARSSSPGRPSRRRRAVTTAGCTRATSARSTSAAGCR